MNLKYRPPEINCCKIHTPDKSNDFRRRIDILQVVLESRQKHEINRVRMFLRKFNDDYFNFCFDFCRNRVRKYICGNWLAVDCVLDSETIRGGSVEANPFSHKPKASTNHPQAQETSCRSMGESQKQFQTCKMHFLPESEKKVSDSVNFNTKLRHCRDMVTNLLES